MSRRQEKKKPTEQDQMVRLVVWFVLAIVLFFAAMFAWKALPPSPEPTNRLVFVPPGADHSAWNYKEEPYEREDDVPSPIGDMHVVRGKGAVPLSLEEMRSAKRKTSR